MSAYQIVAIAPDVLAVVALQAEAAQGRAWGASLPGVSVARMAEDARYVVVDVPAELRGVLEQAFPGSPWMMLANGIDALALWREAVRSQ
ncbi:MAG: hypothetical protein QME96_06585 [Myxococcota bacterium]|nr:hypothetical protein [Myxococcota bacterium]